MQIIINLVQNAKDALQIATKKNKEIKIRVKRIAHEKISITIMDNGNGLDKERYILKYSRLVLRPKKKVMVLACIQVHYSQKKWAAF